MAANSKEAAVASTKTKEQIGDDLKQSVKEAGTISNAAIPDNEETSSKKEEDAILKEEANDTTTGEERADGPSSHGKVGDGLPQKEKEEKKDHEQQKQYKANEGDEVTVSEDVPMSALPGNNTELQQPLTSLTRQTARGRESQPGAFAVEPTGEVSTEASGTLAATTSNIATENTVLDSEQNNHVDVENQNLAVANPVSETPSDIPQADEWDPTSTAVSENNDETKVVKKGKMFLCVAVLVVVAIACVVAALLANKSNDDNSSSNGVDIADTITTAPTTTVTEKLFQLLPRSSLIALWDDTRPQGKAYQWLLEDPNLESTSYTEARIAQRFALATLYFATGKSCVVTFCSSFAFSFMST